MDIRRQQERVIDLIRTKERFMVTCHTVPDADALGSMLGLATLLEAHGKTVVRFHTDVIPHNLRFLEGASSIVSAYPDEPVDATFVMDTGAPELLPSPWPDRSLTGVLVVVDHHATFKPFGDIELRDEDACATAEVVLGIATLLGWDKFPKAAAEPLYAAIVADTGSFRSHSTNARVLRLAANLLEYEVDPWLVAVNLFESWPERRLKLLSRVLETLEIECDGKLAILTVRRTLLDELGADDEMVEGLVTYARMLQGIEIGVLISEREFGRVKISFRARNHIDVAKIAASMGGGGHKVAAGVILTADIQTARTRLLKEVKAALAHTPHA